MVEEMKIKNGYKKTEVGVIPEDWEVKKLGDFCNSINDGTHSTPKYVDKGIPFYSVENVTSNDFNNTKYISHEEHIKLIKRCKPEKGDILLTRIGTLGQTKLIDWELNASIYVSLALLKINNKISTKYLYSYTKSLKFIRDVEKRSLMNAIPKKINMENISYIPIPLPPLKEQKAIATALNDMDNLIESTQKLIDKKKRIKKGTMQELLTGKKRLDGFSGEWEVKYLKDTGNIVTGNTPSTGDVNNYGNEYLFVGPGDLGENKYIKNTEKKLSSKGFQQTRKIPNSSILITCIGSTIGKIGIVTKESSTNQQINTIIPNEKHHSEFLFYMLKQMSQLIKSIASEQAVPIINKSTFELIEISVPPLKEQKAISQILSDMDSEIELQQQKLEKYKTIKKGMMQELLTGRIRLI